MHVLAIAYLMGPFDFLLAVRMQDCELIEQFLVNCLRAGEIGEYVSDTQTLGGLVYYPRDGTSSSFSLDRNESLFVQKTKR
jgi:hypothetical protein